MKKILERLKTDKDFRYDFFIAVWSGIIIVAVVVALIFGVIYFTGKMKDGEKKPQATETPVATASPSPQPTPTAFPSATPDADADDDDPDVEDDDKNETGEDDKTDKDKNDKNDKDDENSETPETVYATTTVNVRKEASTSSASLGKISGGTSVERIESLSNGWSKVTYKGTEAYIKTEFLTTKSSDGETAAPHTSAPSADKKRPKSTTSPAKTAKPSKTSKPKATKEPEEDEDEDDTDVSEPKEDVKPTSVPPDSDNLTGTDIRNNQNVPAAMPDGVSE